MIDISQIDRDRLDELDAEQLRALTLALLDRQDHEIVWRDTKIDKLTFELAQLKRLKFDLSSEQMSTEQRMLFDEAVDGDIAALDEQLAALQTTLPAKPEGDEPASKPKRAALPARLPRRDIHHEPENTTCGCGQALKRVGEDVTEKLDYTPGVFTVERHVPGKWCCAACRTLVQAPVPPAVIDKGIPTAALLAQVLVAKHSDHLPLYRQEAVFARAGLAIPRSTLGAWVGQCGARLEPLADSMRALLLGCEVLHADETPVAMLSPGKGKTHRAYLWAYASGPLEPFKAVVYDFTPSRSGEHARALLAHDPDRREPGQRPWSGHLVCDDYAGYNALFAAGVTEVGCMAHAQRKFIQLYETNKSEVARRAIELIGQLYGIEQEVRDVTVEDRLRERRSRGAPVADALYDWLTAHRARATAGTALAKAIDYSLNRWDALTRYLGDGRLPIDNNHDEQQIRPWATSHKNSLFAGTLAAGKRAADLPPASHTTVNERSPSTQENDGHEEEQVQRRTNHWLLATGLLATGTQLSLFEGKGDFLLGEFALLHDMLLPTWGVHHAGSFCNRTVRIPRTGSVDPRTPKPSATENWGSRLHAAESCSFGDSM